MRRVSPLLVGTWLVGSACAPALRGDPCNQDADCRPDQACRAGQCTLSMGGPPGGPLVDAGASDGDPKDAGVPAGGADGGADGGARLDAGDFGDAGGDSIVDAGGDAGGEPGGDAGEDEDAGSEPVVDAGPQPPAGWHDDDFRARYPVSLAFPLGVPIAEAMPLLVQLTPDSFDYAHARSGGAGLLFVDAAGEVLPYEVDTWVPGGVSSLWVRASLPGGFSSSPLAFHLYADYRGPSPAPGPAPALVWAPEHLAVFHLDEDPTASPCVADSAEALSGNLSASCVGDLSAASRVPGRIGKALALDGAPDDDGNHDFVKVSDDPAFDIEPGESLTLEVWFRAEPGVPETGATLLFDEHECRGYRLELDGSGQLVMSHGSAACPGDYEYLYGDEPPYDDGAWHYLGASYDRAAGTMSLYVDGLLVGSGPLATTGGGLNGGPFILGTNWNDQAPFEGVLDEVRVSRGARSEAYFMMQYASAHGFLFQLAPEESW